MKTQTTLKDFLTKSGGNKYFSKLIKSTIDKTSKKRPISDINPQEVEEEATDKYKRV